MIQTDFGNVKAGFFLDPAVPDGSVIYFAFLHGRYVFHFPVREGEISKSSSCSGSIFPKQKVSVLEKEDYKKYGVSLDMIKRFNGQ